MPKNIVSIIIKLVLASFAVGWALTLFDITPIDLLKDLTGTIGQIYSMALETVGWAADYILLGAVVVVPIWAIVAGLNYLQRKSRRNMSSSSKRQD
ncbi:hypothetical protein GQF03_05895 [Sneathiella chungangensis]|uniref:DUF6460 domain-containing protein n=1 Tax=Sneathiella chungangensis TaxID=1418234 RepID=A0A845MEW7_9PROT|nr:DUF6460 domain-containing protein [Sneathiella chungangensis]MZR21856.1 hypothetical protein [Sneathiella chungangensis]